MLPVKFVIMLIMRRRRKCFCTVYFRKKKAIKHNYRCDRSKLKAIESKRPVWQNKFGSLLDYENCTSSSRKLVTSLKKRKLIRLLIWSKKVYETRNKEQGIIISQGRTMNIRVIVDSYIQDCLKFNLDMSWTNQKAALAS